MELKIEFTVPEQLKEFMNPITIQRRIDRAVVKATNLLLAEVKKRTPQGVGGAKGGLLASIQSDVLGKGTPIVKGVVVSKNPYAQVVEEGRKPGGKMPPGAVLSSDFRVLEKGQRKRKGETIHKGSNRSRVAYRVVANGGLVEWIQLKFGVDLQTAIHLEYVVRRSIAENGIEGVHMFEDALEDNRIEIMDFFYEAMSLGEK